ncbi:MAG: 30S ribosomal protein S4e [Candidatus Micrarchaeota archaeon]
MALKGNNRHLKRLNRSMVLPIPAKGNVWIVKPGAGAHKAKESIPLLILIRDMLGIAANLKEAKQLLTRGEIIVDGKVRKTGDFSVGLMDIVVLRSIKKSYQVFNIKGKFRLVEIDENDASVKSCRIVNKAPIRGGKVQLNLHDGKNIIIEKEEDRFRVGDTVRITIPNYKVDTFLKLEKGANCYIYKGKHSGTLGTLEDIIVQPGGQPSDAKLKVGEDFVITRKNYLFAVSKEFRLD